MFYLMILLCAVGLGEGTYTNKELKDQFEAKINECGSFYERNRFTAPDKDDQSALQRFINAYNSVNQHNSNPARNYEQILNCFATVNRVSMLTIHPELEVEAPDTLKVSANIGTSPDSYDRRDDNTSTSVKDQLINCGSCWAFTGIACLETKYLELTGDNPADVDFSEQQFVDCAYEALGVMDYSCGGGWSNKAWKGLKNDQLSIMYSEEQRPYTEADGVCDIKELNKPNAMSKVKVIGTYNSNSGATAAEIQDMIWTQGAIAVVITIEGAFDRYSSGLFDEPCLEINYDHTLAVMGYSQEAFIAKNSWGVDWGESGFIRLARAAGNVCNWMEWTAYVKMECTWGVDSATGKCVAVEPCGGCLNNGKCPAGGGTCECLDGYSGAMCEICSNVASCQTQQATSPLPLSPTTASSSSSSSSSSPSSSSSSSSTPTVSPSGDCTESSCASVGKCSSTTGECECTARWSKESCNNIDKICMDMDISCLSGGICNTTTGLCQCSGEWTGDFCEEDRCTNISCKNGGQCDPQTGLCKCPDEWTGDLCEEKNERCPDLPSIDSTTSTLDCHDDEMTICRMSCLAEHYVVKGSTLTTSQEFYCNGREWSHKSKANPNYHFDKCSKKEDPAYRTLSATVTLSGTGTCPTASALHSALQIWLDTAANETNSKYESLNGSDPVCHLAPDSECSPHGEKIKYSFKLNQTKDLSTNHLDTVNKQLITDAAGHNISLVITTTKRDVTTLTAEAIITTVAETCDKGSASINDICIKCSPGYYEVENACILCGKGTYSESSGVTQCTDCTGTKSTDTEGSNDEAACVDEKDTTALIIGVGIAVLACLLMLSPFVWRFCRRGNQQSRAVSQNPRRINPATREQGFSDLPPSYTESPPGYTSNQNLPNFSHQDNSTLADILEAAYVEKRPL